MIDYKKYIQPLIRWWWLLALATMVSTLSSYFVVRRQPAIFQANSTLMVGRMTQDLNPNSSEFYLAQQLASTYSDIGNREGVKSATMNALGLTALPSTLVQALPNSTLIGISVTDVDPKLAQAVANELAKQLIATSPTSSQTGDNTRQQFVNDQLDKLQTQIKDTQSQIDKLQQQLGDLNSARQIADMQAQIAAQQQKLSSLQTNFASLLSTTQQGATNTLTLIEPAGLPAIPIGPNKLMTVGLAGVAGLALASMAAFGMEALDDTLKTDDEITQYIKAPILGYIGEIPKECNKLTYVMEEPQNSISDDFRLLRTNLDFVRLSKPIKVVLISSFEPSDGKSTIAANLAASYGQSDKKVILVDADLRKPILNDAVGIPNQNGLSEICLGSTSVEDAMVSWGNGHLYVIPAGILPPNPVEILSSSKISGVINIFRSESAIVIIDSPPIFMADTLVLSGKTDGVLIVVYPGHTHKKSINKTLDQANRAGTNIIGIVVNRSSKHGSYYGSYYHNKKNTTEPLLKKNGYSTKKTSPVRN